MLLKGQPVCNSLLPWERGTEMYSEREIVGKTAKVCVHITLVCAWRVWSFLYVLIWSTRPWRQRLCCGLCEVHAGILFNCVFDQFVLREEAAAVIGNTIQIFRCMQPVCSLLLVRFHVIDAVHVSCNSLSHTLHWTSALYYYYYQIMAWCKMCVCDSVHWLYKILMVLPGLKDPPSCINTVISGYKKQYWRCCDAKLKASAVTSSWVYSWFRPLVLSWCLSGRLNLIKCPKHLL